MWNVFFLDIQCSSCHDSSFITVNCSFLIIPRKVMSSSHNSSIGHLQLLESGHLLVSLGIHAHLHARVFYSDCNQLIMHERKWLLVFKNLLFSIIIHSVRQVMQTYQVLSFYVLTLISISKQHNGTSLPAVNAVNACSTLLPVFLLCVILVNFMKDSTKNFK